MGFYEFLSHLLGGGPACKAPPMIRCTGTRVPLTIGLPWRIEETTVIRLFIL